MNPKGQGLRKDNRCIIRNHRGQKKGAQHFQVLKENSIQNSKRNENILKKKVNERYKQKLR